MIIKFSYNKSHRPPVYGALLYCDFLIIFPLSAFQESYVTHEDNLRLAGEVISVLGAFVILVLEVNMRNRFLLLTDDTHSTFHSPITPLSNRSLIY